MVLLKKTVLTNINLQLNTSELINKKTLKKSLKKNNKILYN